MPPRKVRLDAELVRRGLARSREQASALVTEGRVKVRGQRAAKPATQVAVADPITVQEDPDDPGYASRGAYKLAGALDALAALPGGSPAVAGRHCLDAGASTGGFTDVLLRRGAAHVLAVDVGYGQLAWQLRNDPRVTVWERTNVRALPTLELSGPAPELVVADLSFTSLRLVLAPLIAVAAVGADLVVMVKPQFEVGRGQVGSGGVVREPEKRAAAVRAVAAAGLALDLGVRGVTASPLPGPSGNVEYFLWMSAGAPPLAEAALDQAIEAGPR